MSEEPTYTRAQWEQIARDERCAQQMHRLTAAAGDASRVRCDQCCRTFELVPIVEARSE